MDQNQNNKQISTFIKIHVYFVYKQKDNMKKTIRILSFINSKEKGNHKEMDKRLLNILYKTGK